MFSPLTQAEVVNAIGRAAREAARGESQASEFSRGQLMSAYSATRHLAVEITSFPPELRRFAAGAADELQAAAALPYGDRLGALGAELAVTDDAQRIGDLLSAALEQLRADGSPGAAALRASLQARLRTLADREVELLAEVIEGPRSSEDRTT